MMFSPKKQFYFVTSLYFLTLVFYSIWSFGFTDPNLVFSQWPPFWTFQQFMWQLPKENMTIWYSVMVVVLFGCSVWLSRLTQVLHVGFKKWLIVLLFISSPLIFSNNALSHDVFNYMFNARMVIKYQLNPHVRVAMDLMYDPWTRFMHNIHTPAPYFYGWTALSLIPYKLGFEKFLITYILFRLWSALGLLISLVFVVLLMKKQGNRHLSSFILVLFNPLLVIELISNSHNDGWMMWPALASVYLVMPDKKKKLNLFKIVGSLLLLLLSMSTKYATALLIPVWFILVLRNFNLLNSLNSMSNVLKKLSVNIFDASAILLFVPLLTERSQQFNPWYLSWSLLFYPLMKNRFLKISLIVLSLSSMSRYLPWMWNGAFEYTAQIELNEKLITWIPVVVLCIVWVFKRFTRLVLGTYKPQPF